MKAPVQEAKSYEPAPAGNHVARLYRIVNIGTVEEEYQGEVKQMNKLSLTFELCNKKKEFVPGEGERPLTVSREFTFSMSSKSNLRKFVEGILGTALSDKEAYDLDMTKLAGSACLINVVHKTSAAGNVYALIQGASPLPDGITAPAQVNPSFVLGYGDAWQMAKFEQLPKFMREKMMTTPQFKAMNLPTVQLDDNYNPQGLNPDDIPF